MVNAPVSPLQPRIVEQLRDLTPMTPVLTVIDRCIRAADRIEYLEASEANQIALLKAALREILDLCGHCQPGDEFAGCIKAIARAALLPGTPAVSR